MELRRNLNVEFDINVSKVNNIINKADDMDIDAWRGAVKFYNENENHKYFITRQEYFEFGPDYFKENWCSNYLIQRQGSLLDDENFASNKKIKLN